MPDLTREEVEQLLQRNTGELGRDHPTATTIRLCRALLAADKRNARLRAALERIADMPHSNPTRDTLHGPCPKCIALDALEQGQ